MAKTEKKDMQLQVQLPEVGFARTMFFNRFRVERQEGFALVLFALVPDSGVLVDGYCCVLTNDVLESNRKSLLGYLDKIGMPTAQLQPWQGGMHSQKADLADIINMTYQGDFAETQFVLYSRMAAFRSGQEIMAQAKPGVTVVNSQAVSLLRSATDTQRHLIKALYE